jgi:hypothetical protein
MFRRIAAVPLAFALVAGGLAAVVPGSLPAAAGTDEVYPVPDGGAWVVPGHGWGHGHGLSQWGAQGAASIGRTATEILSAYYPSTAASALPGSTIRVVLTESGAEGYRPSGGADHRYECDATASALNLRCYLDVLPTAGLTVTDLASKAPPMMLPAGADRWAVNVDAAGLHLFRLDGATWTVVPLGGATTLLGPVRFSGPSFLRMGYRDGTARDYRGALYAVRTGPSRMARVDTLSMEDYLLGVVPRESPSSWLPAALQAQAVAARSYSAYVRAHAPAGARWDICDSTACQVFGGSAYYPASGAGYSLEPASTTAAVQATGGAVRTYAGAPIFAQFSASNGGWSTDGGLPYLTAHPDPWDGVAPNPVHSWTASLTAPQLQARYPAVGRLLRLRVLQRDGNGDWGGRVLAVALEGVDAAGRPTDVRTDPDGSPITGADIYAVHSWPAYADGLRSSWWTLQAPPGAPSRTPAAVAPAAGRIDLLERSDGGTLVARRWAAGSGWSAPADLGGALLGGPAAAAPSAGAVQALVRGTDGVLYGRYSPSAGVWAGWTSWGGRLSARPAAVATGGGRVDAFVRGTDGALYQRWSGPAGLAAGWLKVGGLLAAGAGPAAAALGAGSPYVLVRGTDNALWSRYYRAGSWSGWTSMGGVLTDDPAAAAPGPGQLAIFAKGVDGALWTRSLGAAGWSGWSSLGGALSSGPAAAVSSGGRLDVFVVGTDGHTYVRTRTTGWTGWVRVH